MNFRTNIIIIIIVQFQKISILPPQKDWNFLGGGGFCKTKKFKEMYEAQLEFPEGWGGVRKNPLRGGGVDIFWNYTMLRSVNKHEIFSCIVIPYTSLMIL